MAKVAKLVVVTIMTRVIVNEDATYEEILEVARPRIERNLSTDYEDNVETVFDDKEMPFGTLDEDYTIK